jgi:hypothetical protein
VDCSNLVIVTKLHVVRISVFKPEANTPLVVDGNGVLPGAVSLERVQAIAWRNTQVRQPDRDMHGLEFAQGPARHIRWQTPCLSGTEQLFGLPVGEGLDHPKV